MARILIVEDEPQVKRLLNTVLLRAGHEVHTADNGQVAVDMCLTLATYDLVLSDVTMPLMGGHELARWLAVHRPGCRIILMSALDTGCDACPYAPSCTILHKPFLPKDVLSLIADSLARGLPDLLRATPSDGL